MKQNIFMKMIGLASLALLPAMPASGKEHFPFRFSFSSNEAIAAILFVFLLALVVIGLVLRQKVASLRKETRAPGAAVSKDELQDHVRKLNSNQIDRLLYVRKQKKGGGKIAGLSAFFLLTMSLLLSTMNNALAQATKAPQKSLLSETGILITIGLLLIPIIAGIALLAAKVIRLLNRQKNIHNFEEATALASYLDTLSDEEVGELLKNRKAALDYHLSNLELSGNKAADDDRGLLRMNCDMGLPIVAMKQKALKRPKVDPALTKLILWYLACSTFWLIFGTTIGEYVGIKFVAPDADHVSWLSFGRLRPVHTNSVFWGWASLAMLGLGFYVVPRVSNTSLYSFKWGWYSLWLINFSVIAGTICLMAGINNGGGEYREYVWPVTLFFAVGAILTLINFLKTIAKRTTKEIYISNWYMVGAIIFAITITVVAYVPFWQNGLGETIIQGYYMHQGVGMWFMLFTLGLVYYFLPQQLNKPIYSYSLGILAFWGQILFYTFNGTHHFVFSAVPWWLQTAGIVGSAGMVIPVVAGSTNFIMTFRGSWYKVPDSYTLPFFLVGIIFYFTGSLQGVAEAFRSTNVLWHFTDFTVAHSHIAMYGIISFFLWAGIYAIVPRLTGKEAPQITIGMHFWLALIGLLFYVIPLMYGATLKGQQWVNGKPFIDGVILMAPHWLWRAIGGSLMWVSHLFFAYNMYKMIAYSYKVDVRESAIQQLEKNTTSV